jgi:hypothetical protein
MKTIVMLGFLSLVSSIVFAQEQKEAATIPADVTDALSMLYPKANDVRWNLIEKDFEASFVQNERAVSLLFDPRGNLLIIKNKIDHTELPVSVIAKLKTEYPDWSVQNALLVDITGTSSYHVELEKDGETVNVACNRQGDIIKILSQESLN